VLHKRHSNRTSKHKVGEKKLGQTSLAVVVVVCRWSCGGGGGGGGGGGAAAVFTGDLGGRRCWPVVERGWWCWSAVVGEGCGGRLGEASGGGGWVVGGSGGR
jgi:hypothetical protein